MTGIVFEGQTIERLEKGVVDCSEKEGGCNGMKMPRLSNFLGRVRERDGSAPLQLAFDKHTTYELLIEVMFSAKQEEAGFKDFEVLARANGKLVKIPITLPDAKPSPTPMTGFSTKMVKDKIEGTYLDSIATCYKALLAKQPNAGGQLGLTFGIDTTGKTDTPNVTLGEARETCVEKAVLEWSFTPPPTQKMSIAMVLTLDPANGGTVKREPDDPLLVAGPPGPVKPIVTITGDEVMLWSVSGEEGTLVEPKLTSNNLERLSAALTEIVQRRKLTEKAIVVMADKKTASMQRVVEVIATVKPLFPEIVFSVGLK
jgi:biopolymer transport protein ExbD